MLIYAWRSQAAWPHLLRFIMGRWDMLLQRYGQGGRMLAYIIKPLSNVSDPATARKIKLFLRKHPVPGGAMASAQTIERLESRVAWRKRDMAALKNFLNASSSRAKTL